MWNEHFGIGVVEMQAAGLITIAHDSGGPKADIIVKTVDGYLASSVDEYSSAMYRALCDGANSNENMQIRARGRESSKRFSDRRHQPRARRRLSLAAAAARVFRTSENIIWAAARAKIGSASGQT